MSKSISRDTQNGRFVIGRASGEKFSAVEGQHPTPRTAKLFRDSEMVGESGAAKRARIRREFQKGK